jgi:hypothetical protein
MRQLVRDQPPAIRCVGSKATGTERDVLAYRDGLCRQAFCRGLRTRAIMDPDRAEIAAEALFHVATQDGRHRRAAGEQIGDRGISSGLLQ